MNFSWLLHFFVINILQCSNSNLLFYVAVNPEVLLPKARPFGETPLLTVISSKAQRPGKIL